MITDMSEYKIFLGYLTIILGFIGYAPYFRNIFSGETKPHAFSWLIWGVLEAIACAVQVASHAGAAALATASTSIICFSVFLVALYKGNRTFDRRDWITLLMACVAILLWRMTHNPINALILVIIADALGFVPTFRKSFHTPYEETVFTYCITTLKYGISLFALSSFTMASWLFPVYLVAINAIFVIFLLVRRRQIR